ncbi:MAG: TonB-dependent receptor, partial [Planctomycetota bacterium]|nr:TonB-dependent receptor [Planctomycetota bacterium]
MLLKIKMTILILVIFGLVLPSIPLAQEASEEKPVKKEETVEVDKIIVTATKTPRKAQDLPVQTTVITNKEISESGSRTVTELLSTIPGFYIRRQNTPNTSDSSSRLRGLTFDSGYVLVLINGERCLGGGMGEYGISPSQIPPEMIDRIEIVQGPASALYGSDAMGGIVNIITKPIPEKPTGTYSLGAGTYNTTLSHFSYGQQIKKFGYFLSVQQNTSEMASMSTAETEFEGEYSLAKLSYKLSPSATLALGLSYDDLNWTNRTEKNTKISPSFETSFPDGSTLKLKGYHYKWYLDSFSPGYTPRYGDIVYTQMETQYTKPFGEMHLATVGIEYLDRDLELNVADETDTTKSFYLQDEIDLNPVNLVLGGRIDNHSAYGTVFNPKASVLWKITDNTSLRTSAGTAFKSPTIRQSYVLFLHKTWWNIPNPDLEPETSVGYSAGVEHRFSKNLAIDLNAFRNDIDDLIVRKDISATERTWENVEKAFTQGIELGTKTTILDDLLLNLGYAYLDTENKETKKELTYSPRNVANIGVGYEIKP